MAREVSSKRLASIAGLIEQGDDIELWYYATGLKPSAGIPTYWFPFCKKIRALAASVLTQYEPKAKKRKAKK